MATKKKTVKKKAATKSKTYSKPKVKTVSAPPAPPLEEQPPEQLASAYTTSLTKRGLAADESIVSSEAVLAQALLLKVETSEEVENAGVMLVQLKRWQEQVVARRQFLTRPLKEHVKRIEGLFRPTLEKLEKADEDIRAKVLAYRSKAELAAREQQQKLLEEAQTAQAEGDSNKALALATEAQAVDAPVKQMSFEDGGGLQVRKVWTFEVTDFGAIPHEFFTLDDAKVRAAIKAGQTDIPGLRIFQKEQLAVSGGDL